jgi:hypothetical protein
MKTVLRGGSMRKAALVLALMVIGGVLSASPAAGAEWELFLETGDKGAFHYFDPESLERYEYNDEVHAWIKRILLKPQPYPRGSGGRKLQMSLMHYEFNCEARKFRVTKAILIYEDGGREEAKGGRHGHRWQDVPPDEHEGYYKHLCGKLGG